MSHTRADIHEWLEGMFKRMLEDEEMAERGEGGKTARMVTQDEFVDGFDRFEMDGE